MTLVPEADKALFEEYKQQHIKDCFEYSQKSKSSNSIRAYRFAWTKFVDWCDSSGYEPFSPPSCSHEFLVGLFMASMAKSRQLKPKSLESYLAGIKHFYAEKGIAVDTRHGEIRKAMSGIKREIGVKQNRKAPLTTDNIKMLIDSIQAPYGAGKLHEEKI
ncbi:MAG: hypothetical protein H7A38_05980 [Chlamydiales bacterium]|nr:hypothetical protein [Chlamydiales bacterium]